MKTIGMIGGMSWESSIEYYRIINECVKHKLGGLHSAKTIMYSVNFAEIETLQREDRWQEAAQAMIEAARYVEAGGANLLIIYANTMHRMADELQENITIPLLHIADATAEVIKACRISKVGLLGTKYTMEQDFYRGRLTDKHGLEVLIPEPAERALVHRVIFEELVLGIINPASKTDFQAIIARLVEAGAQGIILGCTEFGLLIKDEDSRVPLFDPARIHAEAAVNFALAS